jgi:streptothricin acetyltransferase
MAIAIQEADRNNINSVYKVDGSLWVDSRLIISAVNGKFSFQVVPMPGYTKPYMPDEIDTTTYLNSPDRVIFFAYIDNRLAGQIILRKNWNKFAWVEDIAVDTCYRRQGVGQALMARSMEWTKSRGLPGIMLETQDVRVGACRFYERFGFTLGGFDRKLYSAFPEDAGEIALFWYLLF